MPKVTTPTAPQKRRHNPLEADLFATGPLRSKAPKQKRRSQKDDDEENYVDTKASRQILKISHDLVQEQKDEQSRAAATDAPNDAGEGDERPGEQNFFFLDRPRADVEDGEDEPFGVEGDEADWASDDDEVEEVEVEDLDTFRKFLPEGDEDPLLKDGWPGMGGPDKDEKEGGGDSINLADLILEKIEAFEAGEGAGPEPPDEGEVEIHPKIVDMYTKVGEHLAHYRSGPLLNKPIEFILNSPAPLWEELLYITQPESWTPHATYAMTKKFVSRKDPILERYNEIVLVPKVQMDIEENRVLNTHLYSALEKALFKPKSFLKGFIFPLVQSGSFNLREAHIIGSVLKKHRIPADHCGLALKKLCDFGAEEASLGTEGGGAVNVLIYTLLQKGYNLPWQVVDALVFHFLRFRSVDPASVRTNDDLASVVDFSLSGDGMPARAKLPVIWHQCLLEFARRYKTAVTEDAREALLDLLNSHGHAKIAPEIRRELVAGRKAADQQPTKFDGDDTLMADV